MSRIKIFLICSECLSRNYSSTKKKEDPKRFEISKYCPTCGRHTLHKESK
ncbi:MAG: 50S ribosomal protein L33 [Bacilli bacterium]|nr:50S ribosomal protein L33 [Bacilli bacterium]